MTSGRILGIDYGTKRIGVAVSDPTQLIARGVGTLPNDRHILEQLDRIIAQEEVVAIVVGMPYSADGGKGQKAREVEAFIERVNSHTGLDVATWDESFSSVEAQQTLRDMGMKKKKRQEKAQVDTMAARLMLQEYLDHRRQSTRTE